MLQSSLDLPSFLAPARPDSQPCLWGQQRVKPPASPRGVQPDLFPATGPGPVGARRAQAHSRFVAHAWGMAVAALGSAAR